MDDLDDFAGASSPHHEVGVAGVAQPQRQGVGFPPASNAAHTHPTSPAKGRSLGPTRVTARQATSAVAHPGPDPEDDDPLLAFAPYIHAAPRANSITPERQRRFIATLAATGIVSQAARSIGKSMVALYMLRKRPGAEGFAAAWDTAARMGIDRLEDCALERALSPDHWRYMHEGREGRGEALLLHVLRQRGGFSLDERDLVPGHPVYERIRAEVLAARRN